MMSTSNASLSIWSIVISYCLLHSFFDFVFDPIINDHMMCGIAQVMVIHMLHKRILSYEGITSKLSEFKENDNLQTFNL